MSENAIKWVLFGLMAVTVPALYFMFVVGGFLPLIAIVALMSEGVWGFKLFNAIHLVVYGLLFYWVAKVLSRRLSALPQRWKNLGFAGISLALVAISFLPAYGVGHNVFQFVNLYRLYDTHLFPKSIPPGAIQP